MLSICSSLLMIKMINSFLISICTGDAVASLSSAIALHSAKHASAVVAALVGSRRFTAVGKLPFILSVKSLLVILSLAESVVLCLLLPPLNEIHALRAQSRKKEIQWCTRAHALGGQNLLSPPISYQLVACINIIN